MRKVLRPLVGVGFVVACFAACANIFGIQGGVLEDASIPEDAQALDVPYDYVTHDAIDLDVNTASCDGGIMPVADNLAVWVSGKSGFGVDTSGCGTRAAPCASIGFALAQSGARTVIYVDDSTFNETLTLGGTYAAYTIQGGWESNPADAGWSAVCSNNMSNIQGVDEAGSAAIDINGANGITLRLLTIRSKVQGTPGTGESVYAVRITDTASVMFDNVSLLAQSGAEGQVGASGVADPGCSTTTSGSGANGANGNGGGAGKYGASGFNPDFASNGTSGQAGTVTPPGTGTCMTCATSCELSDFLGEGGAPDSGPDGGDSGMIIPDSGVSCSTGTSLVCGDAGNGCAGNGGAHGNGGQGGGASIALYASGLATTITLNNGAFFAANGGNGGPGGAGATGGIGMMGTSSPGICYMGCNGTTCTLFGEFFVEAGTPGSGGNGGDGGQGGGGCGGPIFYYALENGATFTSTPTSTLSMSGFKGLPGPGGPPNGPDGSAGEHP